MERYSEVLGLPVISMDGGKKMGIVEDIIFNPDSREVKALLLRKKGYEICKKAVLVKDVLKIGRDAVIIRENSSVCKVNQNAVKEEIKDQGEVKGLRIYTGNGEDLGVVKDVLFDYRTGVMEGLELSDGLLQDLLTGRVILPLFGKVEFGKENIVVDKEAVEEMISTGGGFRNLVMSKEGDQVRTKEMKDRERRLRSI